MTADTAELTALEAFRLRWADALRSGKYLQGRNCLRSNEGERDTYCCLGVACDLIDPSGWEEQQIEDDIAFLHGDSSSLPSVRVLSLMGLPPLDESYQFNWSANIEVYIDGKWTTLTLLNDGDTTGAGRKTFSEIADIIGDLSVGMRVKVNA